MDWDEKEEWRQKFLKVPEGFRLPDDDFMTAVFQESPECVDLLLRIVLNKPQIKATKVITQDTLKNLHGRSVRLDIHAFADGQEFDVEIRRADDGATARRARYNSSLPDANALRAGEDCEQLPESYVIFITETDVPGEGQPIYIIGRGRSYVQGDGRTRKGFCERSCKRSRRARHGACDRARQDAQLALMKSYRDEKSAGGI